MAKLTEKRVREIAREEILKRELERIKLIAITDTLAKEGITNINKAKARIKELNKK